MTPTERKQFRSLGWKIYGKQDPSEPRPKVPVKGPTLELEQYI